MNEDLQSLVWRHQAGAVPRAVIGPRLDEELYRILAVFRTNEGRWQPLMQAGSAESKLREGFEKHTEAARAALIKGEMKKGWREIQLAERCVSRILSAVRAHERIQEAQSVLSSVPTGIPDERVSASIAVVAAWKLLAAARKEQREGYFAAALYMADAAIRQIEQVTLQDAETRVEVLSNAEVQLLSQFPDLPPHMTFGSALSTARQLIERRQSGLAARFIADIENAVNARAIFIGELLRQYSTAPDAHPEGVAGMLLSKGRGPKESWRAATHRLLKAEIRRVAEYVRSIAEDAVHESH